MMVVTIDLVLVSPVYIDIFVSIAEVPISGRRPAFRSQLLPFARGCLYLPYTQTFNACS
jgi:hypothetical protein